MTTRTRQPARPRELLVRSPESVRALTASTRQEIVDVLSSGGPVTVAELGRLLGDDPTHSTSI